MGVICCVFSLVLDRWGLVEPEGNDEGVLKGDPWRFLGAFGPLIVTDLVP